MRLRHISKHISDQNWLAVVLDFFIVVAGVFIGIQLGNWNEGRQVKQALGEAEARFVSETQANIDAADQYLATINARMELAQKAIDALQACETDTDSQALVISGANAIRGTPGLQIRKTALSSITGNDDFLSLMPTDKREALKEFERTLIQTQDTLDWLEDRPFENHIENQAPITYAAPVDLPGSDGLQVRPIRLDAPVDELCRDKSFLGAFYLWERTATFQAFRAGQLREKFQANLNLFEGR